MFGRWGAAGWRGRVGEEGRGGGLEQNKKPKTKHILYENKNLKLFFFVKKKLCTILSTNDCKLQMIYKLTATN